MDHWSLRSTPPTTLHLFEESNLRRITEVDRFTGKMIRDFFGPGMVETIGNQTVICSGVTMGGKTAIEQYLLKMIWHMDNIQGESSIDFTMLSYRIEIFQHFFLFSTFRQSIEQRGPGPSQCSLLYGRIIRSNGH